MKEKIYARVYGVFVQANRDRQYEETSNEIHVMNE
jgi:hypothetical protein